MALERSRIAIRTARADDAALLAELGARTFREAFEAENTASDMEAYLAGAFSLSTQSDELADPSSEFLIAERDGVPVGYARHRTGPAPACVTGVRPVEVVRCYAVTEHIGSGVGSALMGACLLRGRDLGCDAAWLSAWQRNPRAIAFYEKWGFRIVGEKSFAVGEDVQQDYVMARAIP
jgi:ribosomal protein S18 acetylase RimI-like enzyme